MVGIIIPCYHSRETLPKALDSLVAQTKKYFMTIIVPDGDGEDYSDIIEEYSNRGLDIHCLPQKENKGPGAARQAGIDAARMCKYLIFLDSDDMLMPQAVAQLTREIQRKDLDIVAGQIIAEFTDMEQIISLQDGVCWVHGKIYKRDYLVNNNIRFIDEVKFNEDSYFNLVAHNCSEKIARIEFPTALWRNNTASVTRDNSVENYYLRTGGEYIKGQCLALKKIEEIMGIVPYDIFAFTLVNCYMASATANDNGKDESVYISYLKDLKNLKSYENSIKNKNFKNAIIHKTKVGAGLSSDEITLFSESFYHWFKRIFTDTL